MSDSDRYAVACNYREGTSATRVGGRAFVGAWQAGNGYERFIIIARSRGGRWISKWEDVRRLTNFRSTTIPVGHPMRTREDIGFHETKAAAEEFAASLMMVCRRNSTATKRRHVEGDCGPIAEGALRVPKRTQ